MLYKKNGLLKALLKLFGRFRGAKRHVRQNPIFHVFFPHFYSFANLSYLVSAYFIEYDLIIFLLGIPSHKILFYNGSVINFNFFSPEVMPCVLVHVCLSALVGVRICAFAYACMRVPVCVYARSYMRVCAFAYVCVLYAFVRMCACVCMQALAYMRAWAKLAIIDQKCRGTYGYSLVCHFMHGLFAITCVLSEREREPLPEVSMIVHSTRSASFPGVKLTICIEAAIVRALCSYPWFCPVPSSLRIWTRQLLKLSLDRFSIKQGANEPSSSVSLCQIKPQNLQ